MGRSMPRKTLRREETTSSSSCCPSRSPPTSDKTGRCTAPSTGSGKTSAVSNYASVSAPGSARSPAKKAGYSGGPAGAGGSAPVDSHHAQMSRRVGIRTVTASARATPTADADRASSHMEGMGAIHAPRAAAQPPDLTTSVYDRLKAGKGGGVPVPLDLHGLLRHHEGRQSHKALLRARGSRPADRICLVVQGAGIGQARERACSAMHRV
jgi:hypothetical protein